MKATAGRTRSLILEPGRSVVAAFWTSYRCPNFSFWGPKLKYNVGPQAKTQHALYCFCFKMQNDKLLYLEALGGKWGKLFLVINFLSLSWSVFSPVLKTWKQVREVCSLHIDSQGFLSTSFPSSPYLADFLSLCLPRSDSVKIYTLSGEWETILLESNCARTSFFKVKLKHPTGGTRRKTQFWQEGGFNDITRWAEHGSKRMRMLLCDSSCVHKQLFANTLAISTLLGDNNVFTASCRMHFRPS